MNWDQTLARSPKRAGKQLNPWNSERGNADQMEQGFHVLIVDDEPNIRSGLARGLCNLADKIETAGTANEALDKFDVGNFQLVISDVRMPGDRDGLALIRSIKQRSPHTTAIVVTAYESMQLAVDAMRCGAFDFICKPIDLNLIRQQVTKAVEHHRLQQENHALKDKLAASGQIDGIIGNSPAIDQLMLQICQVAATDATVLIQGESGTGKELIARAIHDRSDRAAGPFVPVHVGALPPTLLESELFGHEKGSFTGASRQKRGCFERAFGGTLFLDEITETPVKSQIDLLRVLESQTYVRVGGERQLHTDARIVSATNRDISQLLTQGTFREDLYYRLNIVPIDVPPLRSRPGDVPLLVDYFLEHFCKRHGRPPKTVDPTAMQRLVEARWPGNVRQLRNTIERIVVTASSDTISVSDLPEDLVQGESLPEHGSRTLAEITEAAEKSAIVAALMNHEFHREMTAKSLGISVRTLHYKMNKYDLH